MNWFGYAVTTNLIGAVTGFDYQGVAIVIAAIGGLITVLGGLMIQIMTFNRQGELQRASERRDVKQEEMHKAINGLSEKKDKAIEAAADAAGHLRGVADERDNPMTPAGKP